MSHKMNEGILNTFWIHCYLVKMLSKARGEWPKHFVRMFWLFLRIKTCSVHMNLILSFKIPVVQGYGFGLLLHFLQETIHNLSFSRKNYLVLIRIPVVITLTLHNLRKTQQTSICSKSTTASFWYLYSYFCTYFTPFFIVCIVDFGHVFICRECSKRFP